MGLVSGHAAFRGTSFLFRCVGIFAGCFIADGLCRGSGGVVPHAILVHGFQGLADAQHELHEAPLAKAGVVDQVCIDHVLKIASTVVGEQDVDCFTRRARGVISNTGDLCRRVALYGVVDTGDYIGVRSEEGVGFDFLEGLRDGFLSKGTSDLFESVERGVRGVLYKVDVGEAALVNQSMSVMEGKRCRAEWEKTHLTQQTKHAEASVVDLQLRSARETAYAIRYRVEYVENCLRHGYAGWQCAGVRRNQEDVMEVAWCERFKGLFAASSDAGGIGGAYLKDTRLGSDIDTKGRTYGHLLLVAPMSESIVQIQVHWRPHS